MVNKLTVVLLLFVCTSIFANPLHQSACYKEFHEEKGWHIASKKCHIPHATSWQEFYSGMHTRPSFYR